MSLLADLLSRVTYQGLKRDVPPGLKELVTESTERSGTKKKAVLLSLFFCIAVIAGIATVSLFEALIKPVTPKKTVLQPQPAKQPDKLITEQVAARPGPPAVSVPVPTPPAPAVMPAPSLPPAVNKPALVQDAASSEQQSESRRNLGPRQGRTKKALRHDVDLSRQDRVEEEAEKKPAAQPPGKEGDENAYLYAAKNYESVKDYPQALSNYMKALEFEPGNYIIMNNIAGIMLRMGSYAEALNYVKYALVIKKDYVPSLINAGIASFKLDNAAEGEGYLTKALTLDPLNRNALLNLALMHEKAGEYDKAYSFFYKLAELKDIQGYVGLARVEERRGNKAAAARIYREILAMNNIGNEIRKMATEKLLYLEPQN